MMRGGGGTQLHLRVGCCIPTPHYVSNITDTTLLRHGSGAPGPAQSSRVFCTEQREHLFIGILVANHQVMGGDMEGLGHGDSGARKHDLF